MTSPVEGGSNGRGQGWRTPGNAARAGVGARRKSASSTNTPSHRSVSEPPALQAILERGGSLPPGPALLVLDDVLASLERLHTAGITHGHIRPAIIVVGSEGRCRLEEATPPPSPGSAASGLLGYAAPEVRNGRPATPQADIYSATAVFLEAMTNLPPLGGLDQARRDASVPVLARAVFEEGLQPDPRRRPSTAALLRADIAIAGDAFLEDDWRSRGRDWLSAASGAITSGADLAGIVHSPWAGPSRPERDLPARSDAHPAKPLIGMQPAAATAELTSSLRASSTPDRMTPNDPYSSPRSAVLSGAADDDFDSPQGDGSQRRRRDHRIYAGIGLGAAGLLALGLVAALVLHGTPATLPASHSAPAVAVATPSPTPTSPVFGFSQQYAPPPPTATPAPTPTPTPSAAPPTIIPAQGGPTLTPNPEPTPSPTSCFLGIVCN